jgi:chromosome segregation ATPase
MTNEDALKAQKVGQTSADAELEAIIAGAPEPQRTELAQAASGAWNNDRTDVAQGAESVSDKQADYDARMADIEAGLRTQLASYQGVYAEEVARLRRILRNPGSADLPPHVMVARVVGYARAVDRLQSKITRHQESVAGRTARLAAEAEAAEPTEKKLARLTARVAELAAKVAETGA